MHMKLFLFYVELCILKLRSIQVSAGIMLSEILTCNFICATSKLSMIAVNEFLLSFNKCVLLSILSKKFENDFFHLSNYEGIHYKIKEGILKAKYECKPKTEHHQFTKKSLPELVSKILNIFLLCFLLKNKQYIHIIIKFLTLDTSFQWLGLTK